MKDSELIAYEAIGALRALVKYQEMPGPRKEAVEDILRRYDEARKEENRQRSTEQGISELTKQ